MIRFLIALMVFIIGQNNGIGTAVSMAAPQTNFSLDLRLTCGAAGDGKTDDGNALHTCLDRLQTQMDQGWPAVLRIPAGVYLIGSAAGHLPTIRGGLAIIGDGPHQSHILLDSSFEGDVFSWSEAWTGRNFGPPSYDVRKDKTGPEVSGLQVTGTKNTTNQQNAFVFYDRNDHVMMRDIEVDYLNGGCLIIGRTKNTPQSYMREASFYNLKCFESGSKSQAAVEISSVADGNSDATNELDFFKVAIFGAPSMGLSIRNPGQASATRKIRVFGLRIENVGGDCLEIGHSGDAGVISEISIYNFTTAGCGAAGLHLSPAPTTAQPYQIEVFGGSLGPNNHTGILIEAGWNIDVHLSHVDTLVQMPADSISRHLNIAINDRN